MATKQGTNVTRIKATESSAKAKKTVAAPSKRAVKSEKAKKAPKASKQSSNKFIVLLSRIGGYFKGAWYELKQVRWPNRRATWSLTLAVILFSAFFVVLIVLLDLGFSELFKLIIS